MRAVEDAPNNRRRTHHLSNTGRRSERGVNSPLSQFPGTPLSEGGPSSAASVYSYQSEYSTSGYGMQANAAQPSYPPTSNGFDDEGDEAYDAVVIPDSGRSTPSGARRGPSTRSLPPGERDDGGRSQSRPRAQTEDSSSATINQWRNQTPAEMQGYPAVPTLPRGVSHSSNGSESHSLKSSSSSRQLRSKQSSEWGSPAGGPASGSSNGTVRHAGGSPGQGYARLDEESNPRPGLSRQTSHAQAQLPPLPPPMRSRSQSSPNISQGSPNPARASDEWSHTYAAGQPSYVPSVPPLSHKANGGTNSAGTLASASSASTDKKRFSSSSNGTDRSSGTSSQSAGQTHTAATSPATTLPPSAGLPPLPHGASFAGYSTPPMQIATAVAVRVKVSYGDDNFVVVVLSTVSYRELLDKVLKKIRLCGDRSQVDAASLRLRYQDEDGDRILITSEEDVTMAFEAIRSTGSSGTGPQTLALFATVDAPTA